MIIGDVSTVGDIAGVVTEIDAAAIPEASIPADGTVRQGYRTIATNAAAVAGNRLPLIVLSVDRSECRKIGLLIPLPAFPLIVLLTR